ncbi:uncharacterized protein BDV14DRAFT_197472 [Aspergillus stella-maris]|uniref:uncharacterized protein n=1 Tax=Aspergillus stella-maris TaxID=1810926 RepID=UPI003CCDFF59
MHGFPSEPRKRRQTDSFGSLAEFRQLRYLPVTAEMLLGGYFQDAVFQGAVAPLRMKEALPPCIETVVFAAVQARKTIPDLPRQLEEVVSHGFPDLKALHWSNASIVNGYFPAEITPTKHQGLKYERMRKRAERKAAGQIETPSPSPEPQRQYQTLKTHVLPSTNHAVNNSFMVFESEYTSFLPPLVNITIYFTHPQNPLPDPAELEDDLREMYDRLTAEGYGDEDNYQIHVRFLPAASTEECIAHYEAERASRGSSLAMWREADSRLDSDLSPRLPGMVDMYCLSSSRYFGGVLFVHPDRSRGAGAQDMRCVHYEQGSQLGQQSFGDE